MQTYSNLNYLTSADEELLQMLDIEIKPLSEYTRSECKNIREQIHDHIADYHTKKYYDITPSEYFEELKHLRKKFR